MRAKRRWNRINAQILVWAGDKREQLKYNGVPIILPARNETAKKGPKHPFRFEGARTGKNELIPGTIIVSDVINRTPEGGVEKTFDVGEFCDFLERDRAYMFDRGLEIVTEPGDVDAAMSEARPRWEDHQVTRAQLILSLEMDRVSTLERDGKPVLKASNADDVAWAITLLKGREPDVVQFGKDELAAVLSGQYVTPTKEERKVTPGILSARDIMADAKQVGLKLTKGELEGLLEDDQEQIDFIQAKIKTRREAQAASA